MAIIGLHLRFDQTSCFVTSIN